LSTLKICYRSPFSKWSPQYRKYSTLSDFNAILYVGRLWCPECGSPTIFTLIDGACVLSVITFGTPRLASIT
jgi:hypothetical protein